MNIKEIRELLQLIEQTAIEEFEMERSGVRIRVRKAGLSQAAPAPASIEVSTAAPGRTGEAAGPSQPPPQEEENANENLHLFKAPIVGTFYSAPKPDAEAFVQVGDAVKKGTVLCIIEAMKLFNQIESDIEGVIVGKLVENGQPVEYGEPLFEIRPTA